MTHTTGNGGVELDQEFLPLRLLAQVLTVLPASDVTLTAAKLIVPLLDHDDTPSQVDIDVKPLVILSRIALVATVILFLACYPGNGPGRPGCPCCGGQAGCSPSWHHQSGPARDRVPCGMLPDQALLQ